MTISPNDRPLHPISVVAERTGLSPDLLRVWERRYGVVDPARDEGGRRLYSDSDIQRLRLLSLGFGLCLAVIAGRLSELSLVSGWFTDHADQPVILADALVEDHGHGPGAGEGFRIVDLGFVTQVVRADRGPALGEDLRCQRIGGCRLSPGCRRLPATGEEAGVTLCVLLVAAAVAAAEGSDASLDAARAVAPALMLLLLAVATPFLLVYLAGEYLGKPAYRRHRFAAIVRRVAARPEPAPPTTPPPPGGSSRAPPSAPRRCSRRCRGAALRRPRTPSRRHSAPPQNIPMHSGIRVVSSIFNSMEVAVLGACT